MPRIHDLWQRPSHTATHPTHDVTHVSRRRFPSPPSPDSVRTIRVGVTRPDTSDLSLSAPHQEHTEAGAEAHLSAPLIAPLSPRRRRRGWLSIRANTQVADSGVLPHLPAQTTTASPPRCNEREMSECFPSTYLGSEGLSFTQSLTSFASEREDLCSPPSVMHSSAVGDEMTHWELATWLFSHEKSDTMQHNNRNTQTE